MEITLAGFSFDDQGVYDASIVPGSASLIAHDDDNWSAGCYKPGSGTTPEGEVGQTMYNIGGGRYRVEISAPGTGYAPVVFYLDLTDMNWLAGSTDGKHSILFKIKEPAGQNDPLLVEAWISVEDGDVIHQYLSTVQNEAQIKYWLAVRADPGASNYSRNRDGFVLPGGSYPDASVGDATLDVNTNVTGNVTVPSGRTFRIDTDVEGDLVVGEVTMLKFNNAVSFSVYGKLTHRQSQGTVMWTRSAAQQRWAGLLLQTTDSVHLVAAEVQYASTGVKFDGLNTNTHLYACAVDTCSIGLDVVGATPLIEWCTMHDNPSYGVRNSESASNPTFLNSSIHNCGNNQAGYAGYYGYKSSKATLEYCVIHSDSQSGIYLRDRASVTFKHGRIENNIPCGVLLNDVGGTAWTTVQNTRIFNNPGAGLYLKGASRLRGWYADPTPPAQDRWMVDDSLGANCIRNNGNDDTTTANIILDGSSVLDLGRAYYSPNGVPHYLGRDNEIVQDTAGRLQGIFASGADAGLVMNKWTPDTAFRETGGATHLIIPVGSDTLSPCVVEAPFRGDRGGWPEDLGVLLGPSAMPFDPGRPIPAQIRESWRGRGVTTNTASPSPEAPLRFMLHAPYPNPVRNTTVVLFFLGDHSRVILHLYDAMSREVARLAAGEYARGPHLLRFDTSPLPAGVYRILMRSGGQLLSRSLVVIK